MENIIIFIIHCVISFLLGIAKTFNLWGLQIMVYRLVLRIALWHEMYDEFKEGFVPFYEDNGVLFWLLFLCMGLLLLFLPSRPGRGIVDGSPRRNFYYLVYLLVIIALLLVVLVLIYCLTFLSKP